jgi:hypothetical protein
VAGAHLLIVGLVGVVVFPHVGFGGLGRLADLLKSRVCQKVFALEHLLRLERGGLVQLLPLAFLRQRHDPHEIVRELRPPGPARDPAVLLGERFDDLIELFGCHLLIADRDHNLIRRNVWKRGTVIRGQRNGRLRDRRGIRRLSRLGRGLGQQNSRRHKQVQTAETRHSSILTMAGRPAGSCGAACQTAADWQSARR